MAVPLAVARPRWYRLAGIKKTVRLVSFEAALDLYSDEVRLAGGPPPA
ncbi:MAG: hypothetical protein RL257_967, partial [Actinomycetota bacterium]